MTTSPQTNFYSTTNHGCTLQGIKAEAGFLIQNKKQALIED